MSTPVLTVLEEDRHAWFAGRTRAVLKYLDSELGPAEPGDDRTVLDIGGGAGNMAHHLAHYGNVVGLDYSARPLSVAAQRALDVCQGFGNKLPFADDQFDLIALLDTVEHIADEFGVFDECLRVLKPGGKLIVTVPAFMWLWSYNDEINDHERRYTVPELSQKLRLSGFAVNRISYNNFFLFPAIAGIRLLRPYDPDLESPHITEEEEVYQVEMEPIPEPINSILHVVGWVEAEMIESVPLPFGTSVICVAEKPQRPIGSTMSEFTIRPTASGEEMETVGYLSMRWGATVVAHGEVFNPAWLPGFVAIEDDEWVGLITYYTDGKACEIVTLYSDHSGRGVGTALIEAVKEAARSAGCNRLWLITTNDNWPAFRFYQRRGFHLAAVYPMAVEASRKIKRIPPYGVDGIPIRDEIEFEMGIFKGRR